MTSNLVTPTARVYVSYSVEDPPKHPGPRWTRFVCISDTHSRKYHVPPGDVLLHSGDLCSWGYLPQLEKTLTWLESLPHPVKIIIAGNHDLCLDKECAEGGAWARKAGEGIPLADVKAARARMSSKSAQQAGLHYLEYQSTTIITRQSRKWEVYGAPATPKYALGAFQYKSGTPEAEEVHARISPSTEILLTHTPPFGICDLTRRQQHAGCPALAARLASGELSRCRLHVYGHIHEAVGAVVIRATDTTCERVSVNAAMPDHCQAIIVDLLNEM